MSVDSTVGTVPRQAARTEGAGWLARHRKDVEAWGFLAPFMIVYAIFLVYPVIQALLMSVFNWDLLDPGQRTFVGLDNYARMFGAQGLTWDATHLLGWRIAGGVVLVGVAVAAARDLVARRTATILAAATVVVFGVLLGLHPGPDGAWSDAGFWGAFGNTIVFVLMSTPVIVGVSLLLALVLSGAGRVAAILRAVFFAPYVLSVAVLTLIWGFLLNPDLGLIGRALAAVGLEPISWLTDPSLAMPAIVLTTLWWTMGFNLVLFIAGLQDVDPTLYEAAALDGANAVQTFFHVTVPGIRRTIVLVTVLQVIASFQIFGQVFIMTRGGPGGATRVLIQHIYESGFREFRLGYAAALSVFLFVVMLGASAVQFRLLNEDD